ANAGDSSSISEKNIAMFVTDRVIYASQFVRRRVVITGIGVLSPIGIGRQAFADGIKQGRSGVRRVTRFDVTELPVQIAAEIANYPNAVSGQVSLELGLKGRTDTISSGCASAGTAFGVAAEMIQRGELDVVVVGGTEDPLVPTVFGAMCAAGALSTLNEEPIH